MKLKRSIQPRKSELHRTRLFIDSGKRRRNRTSKQAIVWVLRKYEQGVGQ